MDVWIGTSGYSYPDWVGGFYPPGTRPREMLAFYCREFPLVELNFTFYRPPTADMLRRLADNAPADFQFLVKLPRTLSHEQRTDDLAGSRDAAEALHRRGQLKGLLCQLPQSTHNDRTNRRWLEDLAGGLSEFRMAVEFRHRSWWNDETPDWMAAHRLDLVAVDVPDLKGLFPRGWVQSGPRAYVRLHSRNAAKWYAADKERYDYAYSEGELNEWAEALGAARERTEEVLFLFNNCYRGQAVTNARRMHELIADALPDAHVIPPPPGRPPEQRSLFD